MRQLSGTDTSMLYLDRPHAPNHVGPIIIYDPASAPGGRVSFDEIVEFVSHRLHIAPAFRERLVPVPLGLDRPYWIRDPDFDLEFHIRHTALANPGTWAQFTKLVARLYARPLDLTRPPWEMYVIEGLDAIEDVPKGAFATLLKVHHAAIDGVAGLDILNALHDFQADAPTPTVDAEWQPEKPPSPWELLGRAAWWAPTRPQRLVKLLAPRARTLPAAIRSNLPAADRPGPGGRPTRFNGPITPHRVWDLARFPLADVKRVKDAVPGSTVNDVGLAIVGGALREYLRSKDELPDGDIRVGVPVSIRRSGDASASGNKIATVFVPLFTHRSDPLERVTAIHAATDEMKELRSAVDADSLLELAEILPGALMGIASRSGIRIARRAGFVVGAHLVISNVPGPPVPMYFCGARALVVTGATPVVDGMGLFNFLGSYCGEFLIAFTADRKMVPDPEFYRKCLQSAMADLLEAVSAPAAPAPAPSSAARV
jgi:diacylglycerol O-acyltransferase